MRKCCYEENLEKPETVMTTFLSVFALWFRKLASEERVRTELPTFFGNIKFS